MDPGSKVLQRVCGLKVPASAPLLPSRSLRGFVDCEDGIPCSVFSASVQSYKYNLVPFGRFLYQPKSLRSSISC